MPEPQAEKEGMHLIPLMTDFPNKFIYYPLANLFYIPFSYTPFTPTQVTLMHIACAIAGGFFIILGSTFDLILAFSLFQLRAVLDCLDGTIARRKNMSTELGRTIDNLGDGIGFLCLMTGFYFFMRENGDYSIPETLGILLLNTLISGIMAQGTEHYRRKFSYAIRESRDNIVEEIEKKYRQIKNGEGNFLIWYGYLSDWFQILVFNPGSIGRLRAYLRSSNHETKFKLDVQTIRDNIDTGRLKFPMFMVGMLSGDISVFILVAGLPTGNPVEAMYINMAYGVVMIAIVGLVMARFFHAPAESRAENH